MDKPVRPYPPHSLNYEEKVERMYIYSYSESLQEEDGFEDEEDEAFGVDAPKKEMPPLEEVNLAWLVSQVPAGITLSQIKIEFGYNASSMAYEDHYVSFYYEVLVPARLSEYQADLAQYEKDIEQYKKDVVAYEEFCKQEEIKTMEEKLAKLKGK